MNADGQHSATHQSQVLGREFATFVSKGKARSQRNNCSWLQRSNRSQRSSRSTTRSNSRRRNYSHHMRQFILSICCCFAPFTAMGLETITLLGSVHLSLAIFCFLILTRPGLFGMIYHRPVGHCLVVEPLEGIRGHNIHSWMPDGLVKKSSRKDIFVPLLGARG
jgi:hypothetical protein